MLIPLGTLRVNGHPDVVSAFPWLSVYTKFSLLCGKWYLITSSVIYRTRAQYQAERSSSQLFILWCFIT